ncbi:flagellar filament capping protein FliD [Melioribacteraceae bacterium 4301-Me]|uniref:flagellar filament capping protein FliD n=1 Tax=Pyranulibacter aquaticus TaxID=3163344 RepID=UPI003599BCC2
MDILSTSYIDSLVQSYITSQKNLLLTNLTTRKDKYQKINSAYTTIASKLDQLKSSLEGFRATGSDSLFSAKTANTSNSDFVTASASNTASVGSYNIRVNQLAKNDIVISSDLASSTSNAITGTHIFNIKTGDGNGGEYTSTVEVTFGTSETNQTVLEKIRDAINSDAAVVNSAVKTASTSYTGGSSSFVIDVNGTQTTISVNGGGTYEQLIDEIVTNINANVSGVHAEKILDSPNAGDVSLRITLLNSGNYISISHLSGFDLVTDLGIQVTKEKAAKDLVSATVFSPTTGTSQISISSKNTGLDYRITNLSDVTSYSALSSIGLNLGTSRPTFDQATNPDTAGFLYSDVTQTNNLLNAKFNFNGIDLQNNSNTVSNLVSGVTFQLKKVMQPTDTTVNVNVVTDTNTIKGKISDFIQKFNDSYTYLRTNTFSSSSGRGILISDFNALTLLDYFRQTAVTEVSGIQTGNLKFLSQIGITFNSDTGLSISDETLLDDKLSNSLSQVVDLFNSTNGIANTLYNKINPYLGSGGYLSNAQSLLNNDINYLTDKINSTQNRIDKSAEMLRKRYQDLQAQLASLYTLQNSLFGTSNMISTQ